MDVSSVLMQIGLWALTLLVLASAAFVVTSGNLFRAALSLGLVLVGVAGLFILLEAEFLAFVQILVYVGAILTLVIFAIMLTAKLYASPATWTSRRQLPAALAAGALFALLMSVLRPITQFMMQAQHPVGLPELGRELITTLVLPFEVISLVFVAAMVGAIAIAFSPAQGSKPQARL